MARAAVGVRRSSSPATACHPGAETGPVPRERALEPSSLRRPGPENQQQQTGRGLQGLAVRPLFPGAPWIWGPLVYALLPGWSRATHNHHQPAGQGGEGRGCWVCVFEMDRGGKRVEKKGKGAGAVARQPEPLPTTPAARIGAPV